MATKLIDQKSAPSTISELNLFDLPPTQIAVQKSTYREIFPTNPINSSGPWEFYIPKDAQLLHLAKNFLLVELRIVDGDGNPLGHDNTTAQEIVAPIQMIGQTLFKQVKLQLNGVEVSDSGPNYAYRSYMSYHLNHGWAHKSSIGQCCGYSIAEDDQNNNDAIKQRYNWFKKGEYVQFMSPINLDLFQQDKYLLPNMDVRLTFYRNDDKFALLTYDNPASQYQIEVRDIRLYIKSVDIIKSAQLSIERTLSTNHTAKYALRAVKVKTLHVNSGRYDAPNNVLFTGATPRRMIVGLVSADAYHGNIAKNPFEFQTFGVTEAYITAGGQNYPSKALDPKFDDKHYVRTYLQLFDTLGHEGNGEMNLITMDRFLKGSCFFAFNLSPDEDSAMFDLIKTGTTSISLTFAKAVTEPGIEIIVFAEFDSVLSVDFARNVFNDNQS